MLAIIASRSSALISLAAAMSEMTHADSATTSQWGSSGKDASREYQWDRVTDRVLEVYRRVVG